VARPLLNLDPMAIGAKLRKEPFLHFQFHSNGKTMRNHVADFDIHFEEGCLAGLKLVGGALWSAKDGSDELRVTLPAHRIVQDGKGRYFDLLRSIERDAVVIRDFKARVVSAYRAQLRGA
jgi:hypothetical protein